MLKQRIAHRRPLGFFGSGGNKIDFPIGRNRALVKMQVGTAERAGIFYVPFIIVGLLVGDHLPLHLLEGRGLGHWPRECRNPALNNIESWTVTATTEIMLFGSRSCSYALRTGSFGTTFDPKNRQIGVQNDPVRSSRY
jgi:hypothetical protein